MQLEKSWYEALKEEIALPYIQKLKGFLAEEQQSHTIYPAEPLIFHAFSQTPFAKVQVVIMGQDPYHGPGQAHGLSFSVPPGVTPPPSLKNIFKELRADLGIPSLQTGCLVPWAKQGVLLLNATLTVRANTPKSHYGMGWEQFTDHVIAKLCEREDPLVFMLWGQSARDKCRNILNQRAHPHLVLEAAHPSPFSATKFLGCRHFSKANAFLEKVGKTPINWAL